MFLTTGILVDLLRQNQSSYDEISSCFDSCGTIATPKWQNARSERNDGQGNL
jgi:hypothetical protein